MKDLPGTGRAVAGSGLAFGLSLCTAKTLFLEGLISSSLMLPFPLSLPPESSCTGLELGNFRFFDDFACEVDDFDIAGVAEIDLELAVSDADFVPLVVLESPESSESTTNSELNEGLGTVRGFVAFALGFFAGNGVDFLGPAMALEACELYPCEKNNCQPSAQYDEMRMQCSFGCGANVR